MSKVILNIAASLDGFIARADENDLSWLHDAMAPKENYGMGSFFKNLGAVIVGARTYEMALARDGGWPASKKIATYIVTRKPAPPPGKKSAVEFYSGDLAALIRSIKAKTDKDTWLMGGGLLTQSFLREGLLDELSISVIPILLGGGVPLFDRIGKEIKLKLLSSKSHPSGIVQLFYAVR